MFMRILLVLSGLVLVGCGGGGGPSGDGGTNPSEPSAVIYINKKLPVIQENSIPGVLLDEQSVNSKKIKKQYKEIGDLSLAYMQLKKKATFFYKKQLQMNMELGYMDSIWEQIESYCQGNNICSIPSEKIVFTYTESLYKRDMALITKFEEKTGIEYQNDGIMKEDLKTIIGKSAKLSSAKLIIDDEAEYKYVLSTEQLSDQGENSNLERSIVKWNDKNNNYFVREETEDTIDGKSSGKPSWTQYEYSEISGEKINKFTSEKIFLGEHKEILEFREEKSATYFVHDIPGEITYHAEGNLRYSGGDMTVSDTEGYYSYEKFDENGYIVETVNCIRDSQNLSQEPSENGFCALTGENTIKNILIKNVYGMGPFLATTEINVQKEHSLITFDENNTIHAIINCSNFTANYTIDKKGIWFANVVEERNETLTCLTHDLEDNFIEFIEKGFSFSESGYYVEFGLMADLETIGEKGTFDYKKFMDGLLSEKYVDSYTMNNVLHVTSWDGVFYSPKENKEYFLASSPSMQIENEKIYIDLLDTTFEAEIVVIDGNTIEFKNIVRNDKQNVTYPNRNCTDEPGPNECTDGYSADKQYEDKNFADVINTFLNGKVYVSNEGVPNNNRLWMHNETLSFYVYWEK